MVNNRVGEVHICIRVVDVWRRRMSEYIFGNIKADSDNVRIG